MFTLIITCYLNKLHVKKLSLTLLIKKNFFKSNAPKE